MTWIVGMDLRPRSAGALQLARWLADRIGEAERERFVGVHVLEQEHLEVVLRYRHLAEVVEDSREALGEALRAEALEDVIGEAEVVQALDAAEGLAAAVARRGAEGLVVGRAAGAQQLRIVRLGRVARRLIRAASVPLVVVPPDVRAEAIGEGPVVCAISLDESSLTTCRYAERLARRVGRPLAVLHVVARPGEYASQYRGEELTRRATADQQARAEEALSAWLAASGVRADETRVLLGSVVENAGWYAEERRAAIVAVGARPISGAAGVLAGGTAMALAAGASCPVLLVPPAR